MNSEIWQKPEETFGYSKKDLRDLSVIDSVTKRPTIRELLSLVPSLNELSEGTVQQLLLERKIHVNDVRLACIKDNNLKSVLDIKLQLGDKIRIGDIEVVFTDSLEIY